MAWLPQAQEIYHFHGNSPLLLQVKPLQSCFDRLCSCRINKATLALKSPPAKYLHGHHRARARRTLPLSLPWPGGIPSTTNKAIYFWKIFWDDIDTAFGINHWHLRTPIHTQVTQRCTSHCCSIHGTAVTVPVHPFSAAFSFPPRHSPRRHHHARRPAHPSAG